MGNELQLLSSIASVVGEFEAGAGISAVHVALAGAYLRRDLRDEGEEQLELASWRSWGCYGETLARVAGCRLEHGLPGGYAELASSLESLRRKHSPDPSELARSLCAWFAAAAQAPEPPTRAQLLQAWALVRWDLGANQQLKVLGERTRELRALGLGPDAIELCARLLEVKAGRFHVYDRAVELLAALRHPVPIATERAERFLQRVGLDLAEVQELTIDSLCFALQALPHGDERAQRLIATLEGARLRFGAGCAQIAQIRGRIAYGAPAAGLLELAWERAQELEEEHPLSCMRLRVRLLPLASGEQQRELAEQLWDVAQSCADNYVLNDYLHCLAECPATTPARLLELVELARERLADPELGWLLWESLGTCAVALERVGGGDLSALTTFLAQERPTAVPPEARSSWLYFAAMAHCALVEVPGGSGREVVRLQRALDLIRRGELRGPDLAECALRVVACAEGPAGVASVMAALEELATEERIEQRELLECLRLICERL